MARKKTTRKRTAAVKSKKKAAKKGRAKKTAARGNTRASAKSKAPRKKASKSGAKKTRASASPRKSAPAKPMSPLEFARMELKQSPDALGAHHSRMKPLEGEFRATVRMWMGPGDPHVSTGRMVNSWDLAGKFLKQTYKGDDMEGPFPNFEGRGYMGFNDATGRWEGFWIDNASSMMQVEEGEFDDAAEQWTMRGTLTNPENGQQMQKRSVFRVLDSNRHTMESWFAGPDGNEFKSMEINFERV